MHRSRLFLWSHADQRPFSTLGESKLLFNCPKVVCLALFSRFFDVQCALLFLALIERKCSIKTHIYIFFFKKCYRQVQLRKGSGGRGYTLNRLPAELGSDASGGHVRSVIHCWDYW